MKQGTIQLCSAEGRWGWGVYVGAPLLTPDFTKILFLVIPLLQCHHFLHLPEVLGFKSGSFLAFLSTSLELATIWGNLGRLRVHLFSGTKTRLLLFLFLWLSLLFNPWGFMHWLSYRFCGISKGNELKGMCLSSHLKRVASVTKTFYKDFRPVALPQSYLKGWGLLFRQLLSFFPHLKGYLNKNCLFLLLLPQIPAIDKCWTMWTKIFMNFKWTSSFISGQKKSQSMS